MSSRWITDGREAGARGYAEHDQPIEPTEPVEMTDEQYAQSFAARFGYRADETAAPTSEDDAYGVEFERRFGFEATR